MEAKSYYGRLCLISSIKYFFYIIAITLVYTWYNDLLVTIAVTAFVLASILLLPFFYFQSKNYFSKSEFSPQIKNYFSRNIVFLVEIVIMVLLLCVSYSMWDSLSFTFGLIGFLGILAEAIRLGFVLLSTCFLTIIVVLEWISFAVGIRKFRISLRQEIDTETLDD